MRATAPWLAAAMLSAGGSEPASAAADGGSLVKEVRMLFWPGGGPSTKFVTPVLHQMEVLIQQCAARRECRE